jgi:hypothetical protein
VTCGDPFLPPFSLGLRRARAACVGWSAVVFAAASPATAAPVCNVQGQAKASVAIAGDEQAVHSVSESLRVSLGRLGVKAGVARVDHVDPRDVARPVGCEPGVVARLFLDLASPAAAVLYMTDGNGKRVFRRQFALDHGVDLVALESIELVAQSSVEALLAGEELGVGREEYSRSLQPSPPVDKPATPVKVAPRGSSLRATAFYEATLLGPGTVQHGPGVGIESEWLFGRVGMTIHAHLPVHFDDADIEGRLFPEGLRLFFARPFSLFDRTVASAGLAAGVDFTEIDATSKQTDARAAEAFWAIDPMVRGFGTLEQRFGAFRLSLLLGAELDLVAARYVVARQGDRKSVFVPWRVRPVGGLMLGADL